MTQLPLDRALRRLATGGLDIAAVVGTEPAGRSTAPHRHAAGQLFGALRGALTIGTERGRWVLPATQAIWVPPHHLHSLQAHGRFEGLGVYVSERACASLPQQPCALSLSGLLREAIRRAAQWDDAPPDAARRRLTGVILDELRALPSAGDGLPAPTDSRAVAVAQALVAHPGDRRSLDAWAAYAAVSPRTLTRLFVAETGLGLGAWRQRARLGRALELLASGTSITRTADVLGYDDVSAFIAAFKRQYGVTPGRWQAESPSS